MRELRSELGRLVRPRLLATWFGLVAVFAVLVNLVMFSTATSEGGMPAAGPGVTFPTLAELTGSGGLVAGVGAAANMFGVVTLAIWASATASDYSTGLVRLLVSAQPRRWRLVAGKALALAALTAAATTVALVVNVGVAPAVAEAAEVSTADWRAGAAGELVSAWANAYGAMLVWGLLGMALATATRSAAASISIGVGWLLVVESVVRQAAEAIGDWLPGATLSSLALGGSAAQQHATAAALALVYGLACLAVTTQLSTRREVTD